MEQYLPAPEDPVEKRMAERREFGTKLHELIGQVPGEIFITGHTRPDDDAVGAALGLKRILSSGFPGKAIRVVMSERRIGAWDRILDSPDEITWAGSTMVPRDDGVLIPGDIADFVRPGDALICVDASQLDKFSRRPDKIRDGIPLVFLDHHPGTPDPSLLHYVEPEAYAASELVATLGDPSVMDPDAARALLLGIQNDIRNLPPTATYPGIRQLMATLEQISGTTTAETADLVVHSPQEHLFKEAFGRHVTRVNIPGMPAMAYSYITPQERKPTVPSVNPDYDFSTARREFIHELSAGGTAQLYWTAAKINASRYSVSFRRAPESHINLHDLATAMDGGGHEGAAAGVFKLTKSERRHLDRARKENPQFNEMEYVCNLIVGKVATLLGPENDASARLGEKSGNQ